MKIPCALVLLMLASGCQADRNPADQVGATAGTPAAKASPSPDAPAGQDANVIQRYACDAGTSVAVMQHGRAQVSLPDGQQVEMSRVADSQPATYTGASLYFTLGDNSAHLSQLDQTNELACKPQPMPAKPS